LALKNSEISILLLDDQEIAGLNKQYLDRTGPTDVISFPMTDDEFPGVQPQLLGDVVISVETAARQALRRRCPLYEEIIFLLIHGILHLIGYDHEVSKDEEKRMRAQERAVFKALLSDDRVQDALIAHS